MPRSRKRTKCSDYADAGEYEYEEKRGTRDELEQAKTMLENKSMQNYSGGHELFGVFMPRGYRKSGASTTLNDEW